MPSALPHPSPDRLDRRRDGPSQRRSSLARRARPRPEPCRAPPGRRRDETQGAGTEGGAGDASGGHEAVADAANGFDKARAFRVVAELAPEIRDMDVNEMVIVIAGAPNRGQQRRSTDHDAG